MIQDVLGIYKDLKSNISKIIVGKDEVIDIMIISLLAGGHILIEDVPGTGKTMLVKALASSSECSASRIQFTPDLLPSDITGVNYFNIKKSDFEFIPGPIFSNIILADEINRATPKTQSGLLESMEEHQVTIDGKTYPLTAPFMVIATQNPIENMGVFPLPEAQLDRFLVKINMNYPTHEEGVAILERFGESDPLSELKAVVTKEQIINAQKDVSSVFAHKDIMSYIYAITEATREYENVSLGVSPRGALALLRASKACAAINGRNYVMPDDVKFTASYVLSHRIILTNTAKIKKNTAQSIVSDILSKIPVPTEYIK